MQKTETIWLNIGIYDWYWFVKTRKGNPIHHPSKCAFRLSYLELGKHEFGWMLYGQQYFLITQIDKK